MAEIVATSFVGIAPQEFGLARTGAKSAAQIRAVACRHGSHRTE